ncbi:rhoptry protein [Cryptosporidium ubiquitum]|uniref:Rhoptry protein n=1 Tax=Cryptosporidium ubiquitum TaxID=857276 RepID=A0A1J4MPN1_9CRYT|nr:rhoptry protein [Cryptosporidium ubiquitum]OII74940.1 rhoptry protein [Cryptosporidium ubiquitum]
MYPLSPRNCFGTNQNSRVASSEIISGLSCAYPNSSNESFINIKDENNSISSEFAPIKVKLNINRSNSNISEGPDNNRTAFKRTTTNESHELNSKNKDEIFNNKLTNNIFLDSFVEKNVPNCEFQIESYANLSRELSREQLYKIIYQKHDELQQMKLQLNEAKMKELNLVKNYELSIAKQNELKTINSSLENLVNQLRNKKNHQVNSITNYLKLENFNNIIFEKLDNLCLSIAKLKEFASSLTNEDTINVNEIKQLKTTIDHLNSHKEINSEIEYVKKERQQLIHLITALSSNTNFYIDNHFCDNELRNENVKQINVSLCDQIQILEFKLKRLNEIHRKKLSKIKNMIEILEKSEGLSSPMLQEIKDEINFIT